MSIDAAGYRYHTGRGGVVLVNDPPDVIEQVAAAYDIRWLVIESDDAVPAAAAVLRGTRPAWVGQPVLELGTSGDVPALGVYPVCVQPDPVRCRSRPTGGVP
jgi:hypothetical protein